MVMTFGHSILDAIIAVLRFAPVRKKFKTGLRHVIGDEKDVDEDATHHLIKVKWRDIQVGDILKLKWDDAVPA